MQVELLRFIKGVWSLMLSPLINFNSTSDRLSGTPRDTHAHIQMRAEWWMWEDKEESQQVQERMFKKQFIDKDNRQNGPTKEEMERKEMRESRWRILDLLLFFNWPIWRRKQPLLTDFIIKYSHDTKQIGKWYSHIGRPLWLNMFSPSQVSPVIYSICYTCSKHSNMVT